MIWGLLSSGDWIWLMANDTVNSQDFWVFLYILKIFLDSNYQNLLAKVTLLLDNASIHLTNEVKRIATKYGMKILGLPPYWLHLAPLEFAFGLVKGFIKNSSKNQGIDFSRSIGKRAIVNGLEYLTREKVIKMWRRIIQVSREIILDAYKGTRIHSDIPKSNGDVDKEEEEEFV